MALICDINSVSIITQYEVLILKLESATLYLADIAIRI